MLRWFIVSLPFLGLSVALIAAGQNTNFKGFESTLIGLNFTVAILAINFAFVAYQNSEYRQFQRGFSPNLFVGDLCVLLWAFIPAASLVFAPEKVGIIGISALPMTAFLSVALVWLAKREATPD